MATLTPVDHDPFAAPALPDGDVTTADVVARMGTSPAAPRLTPVDHDPFAQAEPKFGIDWLRPIADVRADVAKLPDEARPAALKQWAKAYVAREREGVHPANVPVSDIVRHVARGTLLGQWADEMNALTSAGVHKVTGGRAGAPYDEAHAYQQALDEAMDRDTPVTSILGQGAGAFATGQPIYNAVTGGKKAGIIRKVFGGGAAGGTAGYFGGLGAGEGDFEQRHEYATDGEGKFLGLSPTTAGIVLGSTIPAAVPAAGWAVNKLHDAASPTIARAGAYLNTIPRRIGLPAMSADGGIPENLGARAAAEQMAANQLARAGKTPEDVRAFRNSLSEGERTRLDSNSYAPDVMAPVEMDPSLARLAGSAVRADPEAANIAFGFQRGRQTGLSPDAGPEELAARGVPTRPMLARPITGAQAEREYGTAFGTRQDDAVPMGLGERIIDALKRATLTKDAKLHGLESNAYRTDQAIMDAAKAEANPAYRAVYDAGQNVSIAPEVEAVLRRWAPDGPALAQEPQRIKDAMAGYVAMFRPGGKPIHNIENFDKTKRLLDDDIEAFLTSMDKNKSKAMAAKLSEFKDNLLKGYEDTNPVGGVMRVGGVDNVKGGGLGPLYNETRGKWSSHMESRDIIQAGRDAFKENSDIGVDAFRAITNSAPEKTKLFLHGFTSEAEKKVKGMDRAADKTKIFDKPNIQELLTEIIQRSQEKSAMFANRPERFGQYLADQKKMIETRDIIGGNSMTQRNKVDDEAYNVMQKVGETWDKMKNSSGVVALGINFAESALQKMFGMRADTASALARGMFSANPRERDRFLSAVERRLGANRAEHFSQLMQQYHRDVTAVGVRQGSMPGDNQ